MTTDADVPARLLPMSICTLGLFVRLHSAPCHSGYLQSAVFRVNDGLLSNLALILGVVGVNDYNIRFDHGCCGPACRCNVHGCRRMGGVSSQRELLDPIPDPGV